MGYMNLQENISRIREMMGYDGIINKGGEMVNLKTEDNNTVNDPSNVVNEIDDDMPTTDDNDDIVSTFNDKEHYKWFDYLNPEFNISPNDLEQGLKNTLSVLTKIHDYKLKRVVIKDKGEIVAFLIYINNNDRFGTDLNDGQSYPVLVSTAVHPQYRNRGLLKMMINKAGITKPYLVQTSPITPLGFWEKQGCKVVKKLDKFNALEKCD